MVVAEPSKSINYIHTSWKIIFEYSSGSNFGQTEFGIWYIFWNVTFKVL